MNYFSNLWLILSDDLKKKSIYLFFFILISAFLEVLGIGLVVPIILFLLEDNIIFKYPFLHSIVNVFFPNPEKIEYVQFGVILLVSVYTIKNLYLSFFAYYESQFKEIVRESISNRLFGYYIREELSFHNKKNSAVLISNLTKEIPIFVTSLVHFIILVTECLILFGISVLLIYYHPKGFIIVSTTSIFIIGIYNFLTSKKLLVLGEKRQITNSLIIQKIQQGLGGLREIKIYNREESFFKLFKKSTKDFFDILWLYEFINKIPRFLIELTAILSLALIIIFLINLSVGTNEIVAFLGLFAVAATRILPCLNRIYSAFQKIKFGHPATRLLSAELSTIGANKQENQQVNTMFPIPENGKSSHVDLDFNNSLKLKNLSFSYSKNEMKIFDDVNLEIKKGQSVIIMGPSGSGKSTFVDIILGLQKPTEGKIEVDNNNIFKNLKSWQQKASYVPQNVFLTDDRLSRNIALGIDDEKIDKEKLERAIINTELDVMINNLPDGINTIIGERGSRLSGGQKQRIGLARALYHEPELLILDETTNALDKETEKKIMQTIFKFKKDKTIIIVSHNNDLSNYCDINYLINNKKIILK